MAAKKPGQDPGRRDPSRPLKLTAIGIVAVLVVSVAWIFHGLYPGKPDGSGSRGNDRSGSVSSSSSSSSSNGTSPAGLPGDPGAPASPIPPGMTSAQAGELRKPTPVPPEPQPWESTRENTPRLPPGFVPAWAVNPTPPGGDTPPPPTEILNPIANRRPSLNPEGAEGKRGQRPDALTQRRLNNDRGAQGWRGEDGNTRARLHPDNDDTPKPPEQ